MENRKQWSLPAGGNGYALAVLFLLKSQFVQHLAAGMRRGQFLTEIPFHKKGHPIEAPFVK